MSVPKGFFKWMNDLLTRQESQSRFVDICGGVFQGSRSTWSEGEYLLLHFDLMTIDGVGRDQRGEVYDAINELVEGSGGTRLGGSVYLIPLPGEDTSVRYAAMFWNVLAEKTDGRLKTGDSFYLHYAPDTENLLGGMAQVIPAGESSLIAAVVPPA
jgi:hypothetical protein